MQKFDPIEKWLNSIGTGRSDAKQQQNTHREAIQKFADFSRKSLQTIVAEYSKASEKQFKGYYAQLLLSYTAYLQKQYPPNVVREQVDMVRSFFSYYRLPLGFGVRAHFQFFFK